MTYLRLLLARPNSIAGVRNLPKFLVVHPIGKNLTTEDIVESAGPSAKVLKESLNKDAYW
ncbi:hypothetical protein DRN86_01460 [Candidatus Geothermarchaeota archaeon]|nr:MAG: hypothetical protein DRN86_01460 [Candidatus Geothermarchaeota archaeon]